MGPKWNDSQGTNGSTCPVRPGGKFIGRNAPIRGPEGTLEAEELVGTDEVDGVVRDDMETLAVLTFGLAVAGTSEVDGVGIPPGGIPIIEIF